MQKPIRTMVSTSVIAIIVSQAVNAGGFSLYTEGSAAAIGNFAAGIAAEGRDAAIGWYNPAGLILIEEQQVVFGGVAVFPSSKLTGTSTFSTVSGGLSLPPYVQSFSNLQGANSAVVPALHYALPLGERAVFGLSVVSPFGLSTDYGQSSPVRYAATLSKLETVNISPELGGKLTDNFSVGAGLDLQYARVKFNRMLGSPALIQFFATVDPTIPVDAIDSQSANSGDSFGVGFHAGVLLRSDSNHSRIGLNYQSEMRHQFNGTSTLTGRLADPALNIVDPQSANSSASFSSNALFSNDITLPQIVTLSGYQDINDQWALLGSIVYTGWSSFNEITLNNVAVGMPSALTGTTFLTTTNSTIVEDYRNVWRFSVGANYRVNEQWMMRVGGGYDQTPTVNAHRDVRIPDANRWALSIGSHYQLRPNLGFDVGYSYLFGAQDAIINNTTLVSATAISTSSYNVNARAKSFAQLVGLQVVWMIDQEIAPTK